MPRILIAGYQHETNTFAPSLADWAAFQTGEAFPAYVRGSAMTEQLADANIPVGGFIQAARRNGWTLLPSAWAVKSISPVAVNVVSPLAFNPCACPPLAFAVMLPPAISIVAWASARPLAPFPSA